MIRNSLTKLDQKLFTDPIEIDAQNCSQKPLPACSAPIEIKIPKIRRRSNVDAASLLFGAATSLERLSKSLPQIAGWISFTGACLVVIVQDSHDSQGMIDMQNFATSLDVCLILVPNPIPKAGVKGTKGHAQRHFAISQALYDNKTPLHKWFVVIDDDTFFPSLQALIDALKPYDPSQPWYIGALSEDWIGMQQYGYMAYGGAGMILSAPLIDILHTNYDLCTTDGEEGDVMYRDCIYKVTSPPVHLTRLDGLHQLDFYGDVAGWYEGGFDPILSLHHYGGSGWHDFPVEYAHRVTQVSGPAAFLQRYQFRDNVVLTNAYSIAQYPGGLQDIDLDRVEATFMHEEHNFDWSLGALRPPLEEGREKLSWRLEYAVRTKCRTVRQFYIKRRPGMIEDGEEGESDPGEVSSVFELVWSRERSWWPFTGNRECGRGV